MSSYFLQHSKMELLEGAAERDYMLFPVFNIKEILEYPQLAAREFWAELDHADFESTVTYPGALFKSTEASPKVLRRAPHIGEHNEQLYGGELGFSSQQLADLGQRNII